MNDLEELYRKFLMRKCTPEEVQQLMEHFYLQGENSPLSDLIAGEIKNTTIPGDDSDEIKAALETNLLFLNRSIQNRPVVRFPFWRRWVSAAAALLFISGLVWTLYKAPVSKEPSPSFIVKNKEIKPGSNKAKLTLGNGKTIDIDAAADGFLAEQDGIKITKTADGQIIYTIKETSSTSTSVAYNVISTPKGGQYQLILPDGSKAWLKASSSLRFPAVFKSKERRVELQGEGYFEVAKNAKMPFVVEAGGTNVRVLGTHFNVMAYNDEKNVKTTLLEGAVQLNSKGRTALLKPGEQGLLSEKNNTFQIASVDVTAVTAWKEGYFVFDKANLPELMRQIARWYDLTIVYEGEIADHEFVGRIRRSSSLSKVLKVMENGGLNFNLEGRTLTLKP
jgi:transmembrane sensor